MRRLFYFLFGAMAVMLVSCETMSVGDPDTGNSDTSTDLSDARQVKSIEMKYTDNSVSPVDVVSYTMYFTYDDKGKCTHIKTDYPDSDDITCDITYGQNVVKFDISGYYRSTQYVATLENGRAVSTTYGDELDNRMMTFGYDTNGYLSKITEWCPLHMTNKDGCGYVALEHKDGLFTGVYFDVHPESASNTDEAIKLNEKQWYSHGYSDYRTNIDLNSFIYDGAIEPEFTPWFLLNTLRYLGDVSDCLAERTFGFSSVSEMEMLPVAFDKPNHRYDFSFTTYREDQDDYPVSFTFDDDMYVQGFTYAKSFQKYRVDYYYQTTNERVGESYSYTRSENTYTKIDGKVTCPVEVKINY